MAEIKIQKKKPMWPLVILVIIILIGIFFLWFYDDRELVNDPLQKDTISTVEELFNVELLDTNSDALYDGNYGTVRDEQAIADYMEFVDNRADRSAENDYYRSSFTKLIAAPERFAEIENVDVSNSISAARDNTARMSNNTARPATSDNIEKTANEVSNALKRIQQQNFANLSTEMEEVEDAAEEIDGNQSLDSEHDDINDFFDRSARILMKMHENNNQR